MGSEKEIKYYHVTNEIYDNGRVVKAPDFQGETRFYKILNGKNKKIEEFLEKRKPNGLPSRLRAVFAFANLDFCIKHVLPIGTELSEIKKYNFYQVEMNNPIACPMCLVDFLGKVNKNRMKDVADEYWNPENKWKYIEYFSDEMIIIDEITLEMNENKLKSSLCIASYQYSIDNEQQKKIYVNT